MMSEGALGAGPKRLAPAEISDLPPSSSAGRAAQTNPLPPSGAASHDERSHLTTRNTPVKYAIAVAPVLAVYPSDQMSLPPHSAASNGADTSTPATATAAAAMD